MQGLKTRAELGLVGLEKDFGRQLLVGLVPDSGLGSVLVGVCVGVVCLGGLEVEGGHSSVACFPRLGPQVELLGDVPVEECGQLD